MAIDPQTQQSNTSKEEFTEEQKQALAAWKEKYADLFDEMAALNQEGKALMKDLKKDIEKAKHVKTMHDILDTKDQ